MPAVVLTIIKIIDNEIVIATIINSNSNNVTNNVKA